MGYREGGKTCWAGVFCSGVKGRRTFDGPDGGLPYRMVWIVFTASGVGIGWVLEREVRGGERHAEGVFAI